MSDEQQIVQTSQGWFVETPEGRVGPMESQSEARSYLFLMRAAVAAGSEIACTEQECIN